MEKMQTSQEILEYLISHVDEIQGMNRSELVEVVRMLMDNTATNDLEVLSAINRWFFFHKDEHFYDLCRTYVESLGDITLSLQKFAILCDIKGPITDETFYEEVMKKQENLFVCKVARHKDFPMKLKESFYEYTGDVVYLPQEAQDIFVF